MRKTKRKKAQRPRRPRQNPKLDSARILPEVLIQNPEKLPTWELRRRAERLIAVVRTGEKPHAENARHTLAIIKQIILKRGPAAIRAFGNREYFKWPVIAEPPAQRRKTSPHLREQGLLGYIGYRVGTNGLFRSERREILERAFLSLTINDRDDLAKLPAIGLSNSSTRLKAIADAIAYQIRSKRSSARNHEVAIDAWSSDLAYLKTRFYDGRFSFMWPSSPSLKRRTKL